MRVISGKARGCKLKAPEGTLTRPTADRIKETLFNIISADLYDCCFLDVFSGSGAIAIEALSRNAKQAVLIENSNEAVSVIKQNLNHTKLYENAEILKNDVFVALKLLGQKKRSFDIIFIDPPYASNLYLKVIENIVQFGILNKNGYIIAEYSAKDEPINAEGLKIYRIKDYKTTKLVFYNWEENND